MRTWIVEFTWPDYRKYSGKETEARDEETAVRNILFRVFNGKKSKLEIALLYQRMADAEAFKVWDITEYRRK
jgi:hypothetical protein